MALRPKSPEDKKDRTDKRAAAEQDVLLREVDDALRQDEVMGMMQRYGIIATAVIAVALAGFGGYLWWDNSKKEDAFQRGEEYVVALDDLSAQNLESAEKRLKPLSEGEGEASFVAVKLLRAGIALEEGRNGDAITIYRQVAADAQAPQPYRDLATVREVAAEFDKMKPQEIIDRLKPLAVPGNPWFGVAGEMVGIAYLRQDKKDLAGPLFAKIARDKELPQSLRGRSQQLAGLLGVDAIDDVLGDGKDDAEEQEDAVAEPAAK